MLTPPPTNKQFYLLYVSGLKSNLSIRPSLCDGRVTRLSKQIEHTVRLAGLWWEGWGRVYIDRNDRRFFATAATTCRDCVARVRAGAAGTRRRRPQVVVGCFIFKRWPTVARRAYKYAIVTGRGGVGARVRRACASVACVRGARECSAAPDSPWNAHDTPPHSVAPTRVLRPACTPRWRRASPHSGPFFCSRSGGYNPILGRPWPADQWYLAHPVWPVPQVSQFSPTISGVATNIFFRVWGGLINILTRKTVIITI